MNKYLKRELDIISKNTNNSEKIILRLYGKEEITGYFFNNKSEKIIVLVGMPHGNEPIVFFYCKKWLLTEKVKIIISIKRNLRLNLIMVRHVNLSIIRNL